MHMIILCLEYTGIALVLYDICELRHARLKGIFLNHVNDIQVNSNSSFCKVECG